MLRLVYCRNFRVKTNSFIQLIYYPSYKVEDYQMENEEAKNQCIVVIGMSGTGKTTFVEKLQQWYTKGDTKVECINMDPAVKVLHYKPFLDIRTTHDYKKIGYEIIQVRTKWSNYDSFKPIYCSTLKNRFSNQTKGLVLNTIENFLIDIPGQIEVFTWSASSILLTESIATLMPVKIFYVIDSFRCQNPNIFLSNLLFAQSIQYRFLKFDFTLLLNKIDCADGDVLTRWMVDYDQFLKELNKDQSYISTLSKSIVIHLSDFYEKLKVKKISARTGAGFEELQSSIKLTS